MEQNEMIKAVQTGKVLYGVSEKDFKIRKCKINYIKFEDGKESMDCSIQLIGKCQPKHVGKLTIFTTRKEAKEWATQQMFKVIVERHKCKVVDAKHYVIESEDGKQWRPVDNTQELLCISWDSLPVLRLKGFDLPFCAADYTTKYLPSDKLTYKWTPKD